MEENTTILRQCDEHSRDFYPDVDFIKNNQLTLDISYILNPLDDKAFITEKELDNLAPIVIGKHRQLLGNEGECFDGDTKMLGWLTLPDKISKDHLDQITSSAKELSDKIDVFVSMGIGGSYLGIEATYKALTHTYFNQLSRHQRGNAPEIYFLGQNVDPDFLSDTLNMLQGKRIGINVISKSGTTTETAVAFRILRDILEKELGDKANEFIVATTDANKGALRTLAVQKGYQTFAVPDNVGGRFSILTDVGLFGLAVAGIDINQFVAGFREMKKRVENEDFWKNPAMIHAAIRHLAYEKGKRVEVAATNSLAIYQLLRWLEQIFPESEGHHGYGLWVSPSMYSEKLHANGQMVQDGVRNILETFVRLAEADNQVAIPTDQDDFDGLNYLPENNKDLNFLNELVISGPAYAHFQGGVPNMTLTIPRRNAFNIGQFYYLMEMSVALSGYLAGHNPFIQPGVEAYKKAIFALAGKPGSGENGEKIRKEITTIKRTII